jgi:hypothetical protein
MTVFHPPQKLNVNHFGIVEAMGFKNYGIEVIFNGMTLVLNFIKIYELVQKLIGGERQTHI